LKNKIYHGDTEFTENGKKKIGLRIENHFFFLRVLRTSVVKKILTFERKNS
jgi:hypothetical protein